jgi:hypothetical protein
MTPREKYLAGFWALFEPVIPAALRTVVRRTVRLSKSRQTFETALVVVSIEVGGRTLRMVRQPIKDSQTGVLASSGWKIAWVFQPDPENGTYVPFPEGRCVWLAPGSDQPKIGLVGDLLREAYGLPERINR